MCVAFCLHAQSLSPAPRSEGCCPVIKTHKHLYGEVLMGWTEASCQELRSGHHGRGSSSPHQAIILLQPQSIFQLQPKERSWTKNTQLLSDSGSTKTVRKHSHCFKPLSLGAICYTVVGGWFSPILLFDCLLQGSQILWGQGYLSVFLITVIPTPKLAKWMNILLSIMNKVDMQDAHTSVDQKKCDIQTHIQSSSKTIYDLNLSSRNCDSIGHTADAYHECGKPIFLLNAKDVFSPKNKSISRWLLSYFFSQTDNKTISRASYNHECPESTSQHPGSGGVEGGLSIFNYKIVL